MRSGTCGTYEYQSDFAKKYFAQGRQEGLARGEAEALLEVLAARDLAVSSQAQERVRACTDLTQLRRWVRRAVTVARVEELFEEPED